MSGYMQPAAGRKRLTGVDKNVLRMTAIITMLLDHTGVMMIRSGIGDPQMANVFRGLGRLAFPIYCFLLVEGFVHTRDVYKYMARVAVFVVLSDVPFDLLLTGRPIAWQYQNVMLTMLLGLGLLTVYKKFMDEGNFLIGTLAAMVFVAAGFLLHCDYQGYGVLMIFMFYYFKDNLFMKIMMVGVVMYLIGGSELYGILAFIFIAMYNGEKGWEPKGRTGKAIWQYLFYVFYPAHLLVLWFVFTCVLTQTAA